MLLILRDCHHQEKNSTKNQVYSHSIFAVGTYTKERNKNMKNEKGAIMVEAAFIFPLVILAVMALIYMGLFKLQDSAIVYQVQKISRQSDYMVASPGYGKLGTLDAQSFDFAADPSADQVKQYYLAYHENFTVLYREIFGCTWADDGEMSTYAQEVMKSLYFFMGFQKMESEVEINRNFLSNTITTTTSMEYPMPGLMQALGLEGDILLYQGATVTSMNSADFIRDVDMAWDGIQALAKLFDVDLDKYVGKFKEVVTFL